MKKTIVPTLAHAILTSVQNLTGKAKIGIRASCIAKGTNLSGFPPLKAGIVVAARGAGVANPIGIRRRALASGLEGCFMLRCPLGSQEESEREAQYDGREDDVLVEHDQELPVRPNRQKRR